MHTRYKLTIKIYKLRRLAHAEYNYIYKTNGDYRTANIGN